MAIIICFHLGVGGIKKNKTMTMKRGPWGANLQNKVVIKKERGDN
jgi:hypothetical protein